MMPHWTEVERDDTEFLKRLFSSCEGSRTCGVVKLGERLHSSVTILSAEHLTQGYVSVVLLSPFVQKGCRRSSRGVEARDIPYTHELPVAPTAGFCASYFSKVALNCITLRDRFSRMDIEFHSFES